MALFFKGWNDMKMLADKKDPIENTGKGMLVRARSLRKSYVSDGAPFTQMRKLKSD